MPRPFYLVFILLISQFPSFAQQHLEDSLNKVVLESKDEGEIARALNSLAYEYSRKDLVKSRSYLNAAIAIGKKTGNLMRLGSSYSQLVYLLHDQGKPDSAEHYINEVKNLYEQADESQKNATGSNYFTVGALYYKRIGLYQKAIPFFEKAIALCGKMKDYQSMAGQTLNLGNTYLAIGNYEKAVEQHLKALRIFEQIDNKRGISYCYQSLSNGFTQLKQFKQALGYTNKSLAIKTSLNDRKGIGSAQSNLGEIYFGLGEFDKSISHFTNSLEIAKEVKSFPDELGNYVNIAKAYKSKNQYKEAEAYFNRGQVLAKRLKDSSTLAAIETELIALRTTAIATTAEENKIKSSIGLLEERGDMNRQAAGFKNMADFYVRNKDFEKALEFNIKYHNALDSITNNDLQLQIRKMEEQYNVEKKEQEIILLKKDQELTMARMQKQRVFQYCALALAVLLVPFAILLFNRYKLRQRMKQLEMRTQIAADLHDEVGSSLSSIHMLSQMASQQENGGANKEILARMSTNAKETMDKMSDIVWMIKPGESEADSLIQRMERFAYEIGSTKNIAMQLDLRDLGALNLSMDQRKNIWLIFKEAVNNAVKYSETKRMEVTSAVEDGQLIFKIKDFGKGFDGNPDKKGNGLDNMRHRAVDLKGTLVTETGEQEGTMIHLTVPL